MRTWAPIRSVLWRTFLNRCCPGTMVPLDCSHHFGLNLPLMCCCSTHILSFLLPYYVVDICQFPLFHVQNICSFANISLCFPTWWFIYTHRTRLSLLLLFMQYGRCGGAGIITVEAINKNTSVMIMSLFTSELRKVRLVNSSPYFFQMCIVYAYIIKVSVFFIFFLYCFCLFVLVCMIVLFFWWHLVPKYERWVVAIKRQMESPKVNIQLIILANPKGRDCSSICCS